VDLGAVRCAARLWFGTRGYRGAAERSAPADVLDPSNAITELPGAGQFWIAEHYREVWVATTVRFGALLIMLTISVLAQPSSREQ
jgi:hypothetical protein